MNRLMFVIACCLIARAEFASASLFGWGDDFDSSSSASSTKNAAKTASDGLGLRKLRRAAIGASAAGVMGLAGLSLELCFAPDVSLLVGYGGGPGYSSINASIKRVLGGTERILPYASAGLARWSGAGSSGGMSETTPSFLGESFLTDDQRRSGAVAANLLSGALGLQYVQPSGMWAGSSVFVEFVALADIGRMRLAPTGAFGYLYYF